MCCFTTDLSTVLPHLGQTIVSGASSFVSCATPAFLPSAAVFSLSAFLAKVSSASIFLSFFLNNFIMSPYAINLLQMYSAIQATLPFTLATALPTPIGPLTFIISVVSSRVSPGTTFCLNLALLMPANMQSCPSTHPDKEWQLHRSAPKPQ